MDGTAIYKCWIGAKSRCYNKTDKDYGRYGGRGILVCRRWKNNFSNFYKDMGDKPDNKHSIDRIDVNGNYCKKNCRWATSVEQNNNKANNRHIIIFGVNMTLAECCRKYNIAGSTVGNRLRRGWSIEKSFTYPIEIQNK